MDPSVASETSSATATPTQIESPRTINFHQDSNGSENETHHMKLGHEIQHLLDTFDQLLLQKSTDSGSVTADSILAQMKDKFRSILVQNRFASNSSSPYTDSEYSWYSHEWMNRNSEVIPEEAIDYLRAIAERMIAAGFSESCVEVYTSVRKTVVDEKFKKLWEFMRLSSNNVRTLEWEAQQEKIRHWISAATTCVNGLFADERMLTDKIFNGLGTTNIADDCFMKSVNDSTIKLFNFLKAITSSRRSPDKLFKILDLYSVVSDLLPDIEAIFRSKSGEFIRSQALQILSSLSDAAQEILSEFEETVFGEISGVHQIPKGSVHPLTIYVMDYISLMTKYSKTLVELMVSMPSTQSSGLDFDLAEFEGEASPLVLHFVWIIVVLKCNLESKSKQYKYTSLAHLFVRNNVGYIVRKIKACVELREMIGDDYQNKFISLAEANYQKSTWNSILDCLICGGLPKVSSV